MPAKGSGKPSAEKFALGGKAWEREMKKPKAKGTKGHAKKVGAQCGARKRTGGLCVMAAGWGTNHPGIGQCKFHGGSTPNHVKAAASEEHRTLLGHKREINPFDAIIECIQIRAGEVKWLSDRMAELDKVAWIEDTMVGKQFHLYVRERQAAMSDLVRYSQIAISLGIAERAVRLAEQYGELIANYTQGLLQDFWPHLNEEGRAKAPMLIRARMLTLDQGLEHDVIDGEAKELPAAA